MSKATSASSSPSAILRRTKIEELFGISRSTIYARLDPKSSQFDPDFPKPFKLNPNAGSAGAIGWLHSECQAYIAHLVAASRPAA